MTLLYTTLNDIFLFECYVDVIGKFWPRIISAKHFGIFRINGKYILDQTIILQTSELIQQEQYMQTIV